jgi:hypothetical protein
MSQLSLGQVRISNSGHCVRAHRRIPIPVMGEARPECDSAIAGERGGRTGWANGVGWTYAAGHLEAVDEVTAPGLTVAPRLLEGVAPVDDELVAGRIEGGEVGVGRCTSVGAPIHRELCKDKVGLGISGPESRGAFLPAGA